MIFQEEFYLDCSHAEAWSFLSDMPSPIEVTPGVLEFVEVAPFEYLGAAKVHIGPFAFTFKGRIKVPLIDNDTYRVNIIGSADDKHLRSHFSAEAYTQTLPAGPNRTRVTLEVHVGMGGIIGRLGTYILTPKAKEVVETYAEAVTKEIERRRLVGSHRKSSAYQPVGR